MERKHLMIWRQALLAALLVAARSVVTAQEPKPAAQQPAKHENLKQPSATEPQACAELRRISEAFVAETVKASQMTPEERRKSEQQFLTDSQAASKACRTAVQASKDPQGAKPGGVQSVACTPKTGTDVEKQFCAAIAETMARYRPGRVATNRTLAQTTIEFRAWSQDDRISLAAVVVTDPIGKNSEELIFTPQAAVATAASRAVIALGQILVVPATIKNIAWIVTVSGAEIE